MSPWDPPISQYCALSCLIFTWLLRIWTQGPHAEHWAISVILYIYSPQIGFLVQIQIYPFEGSTKASNSLLPDPVGMCLPSRAVRTWVWLAIHSPCVTYGEWYTVGVELDLTTETVFSLARLAFYGSYPGAFVCYFSRAPPFSVSFWWNFLQIAFIFVWRGLVFLHGHRMIFLDRKHIFQHL